MPKDNVEEVKAGEQVTVTYRGYKDRTETVVVKLACSNNNGVWFCITHQEGFWNNFMKDTHIEEGDHRLVWICGEHGVEQP